MARIFKAVTARRAQIMGILPPRPYGYTVVVEPPIQHRVEGEDVEGLGWIAYNPPRQVTIRCKGWFKFKADAERFAGTLADTERRTAA